MIRKGLLLLSQVRTPGRLILETNILFDRPDKLKSKVLNLMRNKEADSASQ